MVTTIAFTPFGTVAPKDLDVRVRRNPQVVSTSMLLVSCKTNRRARLL